MMFRGATGGAMVLLVLMGVASAGFMVGLSADSPEEAHIADELKEGQQEAVEDADSEFGKTLAKSMFAVAIPVGNTASIIGYQNSGWVSPFWAAKLFEGVMLVTIGAVLYHHLSRVRRLIGS